MIIKSQSEIKDNEKGLYIVSTPIGNLKDITFRAIETLKKSSYILCEDTRVSKNLLDRYEVKSKLISNHKFNETKNLNKIIDLLKSGEISGFSERFFFYGFLPDKKQTLINDLKKFSKLEGSFVFFVSPKKINRVIPELKNNFTGRKIVFCREISKLYEEYIRKDIDDLELFEKEPKGELTVVISEKKNDKNSSQELSESDKVLINKMIKKLSVREITDLISQNKIISKKKIYNYCLKLKNEI